MPTCKHIISILSIGALFLSRGYAQVDTLASSEVTLPSARIELIGEADKRILRFNGRSIKASDVESDIADLDRLLLAHGFIGSVKKIDSLNDSIFIRYDLGQSYAWHSLSTNDEVQWVMAKSGVNVQRFQKDRVSPVRIDRMMEKGLRYLENNGFPFASFHLDSVLIEQGKVSAALVLHKGRFVQVDSVILEGDLRVRTAYLTNYLGIKEGSPYNEKAIRRIPEKLSSVRFLTQIKNPLVTFEEDVTKVHLYLNKRNASNFDGIVGFLPDPSDGSVLITGDVKLHLENALRQGEVVDLNWRKLQSNTQELNVMLITPYVLNSGFSLDGNLKIYRRDTLFTDVFRQVGLRYALGAGDHLRLFFDRQTTDLISTSQYAAGLTPPFLDRAINAYGAGLRVEQVDYRMNPSKGVDFDVQGGLGIKQIIRNQRLPEELYDKLELRTLQFKAALDASYYISPIKRVVWHQRMMASGLANDQLFNNEAYRIGGLRTIRGFNEESIFATTFAVLRSELRYQLDRDGYVFGFFDGAWYENASINRLGARRDTPYGFGAGIAFGTKAGNFSLSYALGSQQSNPVLLRASKIHFGFLSLF
ncbi:MAG: BamA/TamA family outer membrane protein [Flavobacteriales bacterium]|nr:BamA/TamA family outer membrane protein [Flavobacteriales bacterium]